MGEDRGAALLRWLAVDRPAWTRLVAPMVRLAQVPIWIVFGIIPLFALPTAGPSALLPPAAVGAVHWLWRRTERTVDALLPPPGPVERRHATMTGPRGFLRVAAGIAGFALLFVVLPMAALTPAGAALGMGRDEGWQAEGMTMAALAARGALLGGVVGLMPALFGGLLAATGRHLTPIVPPPWLRR